MTPILTINKEQGKRILIGMGITMALSGLAYLSGVLPEIIPNPLVLTIVVGLIDLLKKALTDEQNKFLGII